MSTSLLALHHNAPLRHQHCFRPAVLLIVSNEIEIVIIKMRVMPP